MILYDDFCSIDRDGRRMLKVLSRSFQTPSCESFCRLVDARINSCSITKTVKKYDLRIVNHYLPFRLHKVVKKSATLCTTPEYP